MLPLRIVRIFFLWEWNAGDESEEEGDEYGCVDRDPAVLHVESDEEDAPPHDSFAKVIRVSRVPPETRPDKLACSRSWIG